jgi:hypothetical protein
MLVIYEFNDAPASRPGLPGRRGRYRVLWESCNLGIAAGRADRLWLLR